MDLILSQLHALREDVQEIKQVQKTDSAVIGEIRDTLGATARAVDKDALAILDHERRITKLEKTIR